MPNFCLESRKVTPPGIMIVKTSGYFDDKAGKDFQALVFQHMEKGEKFYLFNLKDTPAMNSNGISQLLEMMDEICYERHGEVSFCCLSGALQSIFRMTGITSSFPIYDTEESALKKITEANA